MNIMLFSLKVETKELYFHDANFTVSSPINKSEINTQAISRLNELNLKANHSSFRYVLKDNQLYVEGEAYEEIEYPVTDLIFSE